jgi:hypothetical protein
MASKQRRSSRATKLSCSSSLRSRISFAESNDRRFAVLRCKFCNHVPFLSPNSGYSSCPSTVCRHLFEVPCVPIRTAKSAGFRSTAGVVLMREDANSGADVPSQRSSVSVLFGGSTIARPPVITFAKNVYFRQARVKRLAAVCFARGATAHS